MKRSSWNRWAILAALCVLVAACSATQVPTTPATAPTTSTESAPSASNKIEAILLQLNDVYEIGPVANGTQGGLARVAQVRQELLAENPNTYTVLAGDFLSPSALGTAKVDGVRLNGRQMVASLNTLGLDIVTFGNHEWDIKEGPLRDRLSESEFRWTSANVFDSEGQPFPGVSSYEILTASAPNGESFKIGIVGVTTPSHGKSWVTIEDPLEAMKSQLAAIRDQVDVLIGLTHLALDEDQLMAEQVPQLALILGGHEHENFYLRRGPELTPIAKADSNAKSVYVHRLLWDPESKKVEVTSEFLPITDAIDDEPRTAQVVADWTERAFKGFRADGFEPEEMVAIIPEELDGLESSVRNQPTNLTRLIADGMRNDVPGAELTVFNSGSIRIDDKLQAGGVTQYDVIRALPYGGPVFSTEISGRFLARALDQGLRHRGSGGYLQTTGNVEQQEGGWAIDGKLLVPDQLYLAAFSDYLATGQEDGFEWLNVDADDPEFRKRAEHSDVRQAMIAELRQRFPAPK